MSPKLQKKLFKKYPKIFQDRKKSLTQTAMCWGIETGDGWFWLLDLLCAMLQFDTDHNQEPQVIASQVKEKYGGLRFYNNGASDTQEGIIRLAERMSYSICENCGSTEATQNKKGWILTLCKKCRKNRKDIGR